MPPICGENAGQHLYLDAGANSDTSATLSVVTTGTSDERQGHCAECGVVESIVMLCRRWRILVSHILCSSTLNPPTGCLQYLWGGSTEIFQLSYMRGLLQIMLSSSETMFVGSNKLLQYFFG